MVPFDSVVLQTTYEDVKRLIHSTVHKFYEKYGGDYEELVSEANLAFMVAYNTYNPSRAKFSTWLVRMIVWRLLSLQRVEAAFSHEPLTDVGEMTEVMDLSDLINGMSDDAKTVVNMVIASPRRLTRLVEKRGRGTPVHYRGALRELLLDLNWTTKQIQATYEEIRNLLYK